MKRALLLGHPLHVRIVKQLVNDHSSSWRAITSLRRLPFVHAVIIFGEPRFDDRVAAWARRFRKPVGLVWTGQDLAAIDRGYDAAARVRARRYRHACCSSFIKEELRELGIDAMQIPNVLTPNDKTHAAAQLEMFFDAVAKPKRASRQRAVVSGSPQRVAAFIESATPLMPEWEFHAAISGSRAERIDDVLALIGAKRWYRLADRREDRLFRVAARLFGKRRFRPRQTVSTIRDRVDEPQQEGVVQGDFPLNATS